MSEKIKELINLFCEQRDFAKVIIPSLAGNVPLKRMGTESEISSVIGLSKAKKISDFYKKE